MRLICTLSAIIFIYSACDKPDNPIIPPPPPVKTDCIVTVQGSQDVANTWYQTTFFYNDQRRVDSTINHLHYSRFYYADTQLIKRELRFAGSRQLLKYDSLFYNPDGKLQQIKIYDDWQNPGIFVVDFIITFTYSGNKITKLLKSERYSGNSFRDITYDYVYDAAGNITQINISWNTGGTTLKYYYSNDDNPLATLKIPMVLYTYIGGLNQPEFMPTEIPVYLSSKRMIRRDDGQGNANIKMEIGGSYAEGFISIKDNNFHMSTISLSCR